MPSNYREIREQNIIKYGTDIGRIGAMLLAERYDDRTHFIFELLQNAEDALSRRNDDFEKRTVTFELSQTELLFKHYGIPFTENDVKAICGIGEGNKALTEIGRFGIGFKSVYVYTNHPEIHSGDEHFAIEEYVKPVKVDPISLDKDSTIVRIPLRVDMPEAFDEIAAGFERLGPRVLMFLHQIEQIEWRVTDGLSGFYIRSKPEALDEGVSKLNVIGQKGLEQDIEESWLVFSEPVASPSDNEIVGQVELAFALTSGGAGEETISRVSSSPLVVYFPTALESNLGFLLQGPFRTTPSRDNIPKNDRWNINCVEVSAQLLERALLWLRDEEKLSADILGCLPIDSDKFPEESMLWLLFDKTYNVLSTAQILPNHSGTYSFADHSRLGRTDEIRQLLSPEQLGQLLDEDGPVDWLSREFTPDRNSELREYLMYDLAISEITPRSIVSNLDENFLKTQPDEWIIQLYEFLDGQRALYLNYEYKPIIRLEDGSHVRAFEDEQPQAFLSSEIKTGFPIVKKEICAAPVAFAFLESLGLTTPDPVDDVVRNILPKYQNPNTDEIEESYSNDIKRILKAYTTDSIDQRDKLISALRETPIIWGIDAGTKERQLMLAEDLYLSTERLRNLFDGIQGIYLVDSNIQVLRGERVRALLEACGAHRHLYPVREYYSPYSDWAKDLRKQKGQPSTSGRNDRLSDYSLHGIEEFLDYLDKIDPQEASRRSKLLWHELNSLEERSGTAVFRGSYSWTYYGNYQKEFDSRFVRLLNSRCWVPIEKELSEPKFVLFDSLDWEPNAFLQSLIKFKSPVIDQLAEQAGIEPATIDLIKKHGVTSYRLKELLGLKNHVEADTELGKSQVEMDQSSGNREVEQSGSNANLNHEKLREPARNTLRDATKSQSTEPKGASPGKQSSPNVPRIPSSEAGTTPGERKFVSYISVHPGDESQHCDDLDHQERIDLEEKAIVLIENLDPGWKRTETNNPGYDLIKKSELGEQLCEVKAMKGTLEDRPVGMSRAQFAKAVEYGPRYWLFVVENTGTTNAQVVRIQDPAGRAQTFTFDKGWKDLPLLDE